MQAETSRDWHGRRAFNASSGVGANTARAIPSHKMSMQSGAPNSVFIDWRTASRAGIAYTLGVFVIAFVVGTIRVTLVAPRLGALIAVVLEAPIVLVVSWQVSLWCNRRFNMSRDTRARADGSRGLLGSYVARAGRLGFGFW
jgi:hypothetical protein